MKTTAWLIIVSNGGVSVCKGKPAIDFDEVAIFLDIELPNALFRKPRLEAKIVVPDEAAAAEVIETTVTENVREAIETATGLQFSISVVCPKDEEEAA